MFRTEITPQPSSIQIDFQSDIFLLGSCFAENVGNKLIGSGFHAMVNPFGVLYNPLSVFNALHILLSEKIYKKDDLEFRDGRYFSFDHYTRFSNHDEKECLEKINENLKQARQHLKKTNILIITFGTSWAYRYKDSGKVAANCHKIPAGEFDRFFIDIHEIIKQWQVVKEMLQSVLPDLNVIFTVSPIRHMKDGAAGNQRSKANLILAVHEMVAENKKMTYFPSYEIMMDDLRDYRFYKEDMVHPSDQAINYIWDKFKDTHISKSLFPVMDEVGKIHQASMHRTENADSKTYKDFIRKNITKAESLKTKYGINIEEIIKSFYNKI